MYSRYIKHIFAHIMGILDWKSFILILYGSLKIYHLYQSMNNYSSEVILIWYSHCFKWVLNIDKILLSNRLLISTKYELNKFTYSFNSILINSNWLSSQLLFINYFKKSLINYMINHIFIYSFIILWIIPYLINSKIYDYFWNISILWFN